MRTALVVVAGVLAAAAAAIALNVVLLGYSSPRTEPVGRLSPVSGTPAPTVTAPTVTVTTPASPAPPASDHGHGGNELPDD